MLQEKRYIAFYHFAVDIKRIIILGIIFIVAVSCNESDYDRFDKDHIGHCVPKGEVAFVKRKWKKEPFRRDGDTVYNVAYLLSCGDSCFGELTDFDYVKISKGDSVGIASKNSFCEKNFGRSCWVEFFFRAGIFLAVLLVGGALYLLYWFWGWLADRPKVEKVMLSFGEFLEPVMEFFFGDQRIIYTIWSVNIIGVILCTVVFWKLENELNPGYFQWSRVLMELGIVYVLGGIIIWLAGRKTFVRNYQILMITVFVVSLLTLIFGEIIQLSYVDMIRVILEHTSAD